ncbi:MAG: DUF4062 domain-containing protein [Halobacteriota archaeon]
MAEYRKVIKIFIGSPGDLVKERERFYEIVKEVNNLKAYPMGVQLEPVGWEETLPGRGRPQELINEDVIKRSDLIVLLLWKRWGTPTGKYSSGFEEEYELAKSMNEKTKGKPEIWLYFREVPKNMLADPGEQLRQVWDFRTKIEKEQSFFYHAYKDENDWVKSLRVHLCRWLDKTEEKAKNRDYLLKNIQLVFDLREGRRTWQEVIGDCDGFIEDTKAQCGMHLEELAQVHFFKGWAHNKSLGSNEDNEQAKRSFEQAKDILNRCENLSPESLYKKAYILHQEGIAQQRSKKYNFALQYLNEALKIREEELKDIVDIAFTKFQIFLVNEDMGKYKDGYPSDLIESLEKLLNRSQEKLHERRDRKENLMRHNIAYIHQRLGAKNAEYGSFKNGREQLTEAIKRYIETIEEQRLILDNGGIAMAKHRLGQCYYVLALISSKLKEHERVLREIEEAQKHLEEASEIFNRMGDSYRQDLVGKTKKDINELEAKIKDNIIRTRSLKK